MHLLTVCLLFVALNFVSPFLITAGWGGRATASVKLRGVTSAMTFPPVTRLAPKAIAQTMLSASVRSVPAVQTTGWNLYGRVPNDDWLFATHKLIDKDILKKSFVEAVQQELPITLAHFNRRKAIYTAVMITKGVIGIFAGLALMGWLAMLTKERMRKEKVLELELRGFSTPISASYKGAEQAGRAIEGNPDWIDLSRRNQNRVDDEQRRKEEEDESDEDRPGDERDGGTLKDGDEDGSRPSTPGGGSRDIGGNSSGSRKSPPPSKGTDSRGKGAGKKDTGADKRRGKRDEADPDVDYSDIND